jgi:GMP synthase (glutamine-hydrolysing)
LCARHDTIAVIDNGGQFTHLIATRIRDAIHVKSIIVDPETDPSGLEDVKGIILSGSPASLNDDDRPGFNSALLDVEKPVLGLCYGLHLIARHYGGTVEYGAVREYGHARLRLGANGGEDDGGDEARGDRTGDAEGGTGRAGGGDAGGEGLRRSPLFSGLSDMEQVWMSHGDKVADIPEGFITIGSTPDCPFAAVQNPEGTRFGLQFHPEVEYTEHGVDILRNFVIDICKASPTWSVDSYLEDKVGELRETVGDRPVFLLASGGVDSTVCAALLARALEPSQVRAVHIDNGLMRKDVSAQVKADLAGIGVDADILDAGDEFLSRLEGKVEPEEKRLIIGQAFIDVSDDAARDMGMEDWLLAQGTIYPDTIESGATRHADVIKTHHNRVPVIREMLDQGKIIEPISELYKVEVRRLGELMDLPRERVWRHPFPGPGLGIRLLCSAMGEDDNGAREAWEGLEPLMEKCADIIGPAGLGGTVLPVRSVGVMGDARSYEHPLLVWWKAPTEGPLDTAAWEGLWEIATTVTNRVKGVNRVVLLIHPGSPPLGGECPACGSSAHPPWLALEKCHVEKGRLDILREADAAVMGMLEEFGVMDEIWQCPTVLLPLSLNGRPLAVIRPIYSTRAMTARAAPLPTAMIERLRVQAEALGIGGWGVDLTHKPPGTIEWE